MSLTYIVEIFLFHLVSITFCVFLVFKTNFSQLGHELCTCGRIVVSVVWLVHIIIFMLVSPPVDTFLNKFFVTLDKAWGAVHLSHNMLFL